MRELDPRSLAALLGSMVLAATTACGKDRSPPPPVEDLSGQETYVQMLPLGDASTCSQLCGQDPCSIVDEGGEKQARCVHRLYRKGRGHEGLRGFASRARSAVARWFEEAAYEEDASVTSFAILARELEAHGAPVALVEDAKASARDEVRHARVMNAFARRHGGRRRTTAKKRKPRVRVLEAMLRENAREGCVNETYAALVARWQAEHAADPAVRAAMTRIANDEARHASLAWRIAAWSESVLDEPAKARIDEERTRALAALQESAGDEPDPEAKRAIGLPSAAAARWMTRALTASLFVGLVACKKSEELPPLAGTEPRDCDAAPPLTLTTVVPYSAPICDDGGDGGCESQSVYCHRLCPVITDSGALLSDCIVVEDAGDKSVECKNVSTPCQ